MSTGSQEHVRLDVEGMHCASCAGGVASALRGIKGVQEAGVSLHSGQAEIIGADLDPEALIGAVRRQGYDARLATSSARTETEIEHRQHAHARGWGRRALVGGAMALAVMAIHWGGMLVGLEHVASPESPWLWIMACLSTIAQVYVGGAFYASAWRAARHARTNMDTLIAIGATAAYAMSVGVVIAELAGIEHTVPLYFGESAGLLTLISLGHWIEARTTAAAGSAVRELLALTPDKALRLADENDAEGQMIPAAELQVGDLILVRAGERLPVDGSLIRGRSSLDESIVTGESMPVEHGEGDQVIAGSVNLGSPIVVRTETAGETTTIARIADMVRRAQTSKTQIQQLADRVTSIFIPGVLGIAAATFLGWGLLAGDGGWIFGLINSVSVLIIACPCALGLATPTVVMVAGGHASKRGILIKSAAAIERITDVKIVLFDKTGTLTEGRPRVTGASDETLRIAASLSRSSTHPLSDAIMREAGERAIEVPPAEDVHERAGAGLEGIVDGQAAAILSRAEAERTGAALQHPAPHATSSVVLHARQVVGEITFEDEVRPAARDLITALRGRDLCLMVLTGDREEAAHAFAERVGLRPEEIRAGLSPEDKLETVRSFGDDERVMMVGDGINDAAALAATHTQGGVAVAVATGSNIAIESAQVVVPANRPMALDELFTIGALGLRTIKQNLTQSFLYNGLAIPIAAFGLLGIQGPLIAAGAMAVSDMMVIGNSLRLKRRLKRLARGPAPHAR